MLSKEDTEEFYRKMKDYSEAGIVEIANVIGNSYEAAHIMQCTAALVLEVNATFEAEVERLREENETLKKQMEDDLK